MLERVQLGSQYFGTDMIYNKLFYNFGNILSNKGFNILSQIDLKWIYLLICSYIFSSVLVRLNSWLWNIQRSELLIQIGRIQLVKLWNFKYLKKKQKNSQLLVYNKTNSRTFQASLKNSLQRCSHLCRVTYNFKV